MQILTTKKNISFFFPSISWFSAGTAGHCTSGLHRQYLMISYLFIYTERGKTNSTLPHIQTRRRKIVHDRLIDYLWQLFYYVNMAGQRSRLLKVC